MTDKPFGFPVSGLIQELAFQVRGYAKEVGTSCDMPTGGVGDVGCDALTLGVRCGKCARRLCPGHTYWKLAPKPEPRCPYCVLAENENLFEPTTEDTDDT